MNEALTKLSSALMIFHKSLLDYQTAAAQREDNKKYSPLEVLNMSFQDPRFQWLRTLSKLIIQADIRTSKKVDPGTLEAPQIFSQLKEYLNHPDFIDRYEIALVSNPTLATKLSMVQTNLDNLEKLIN